MNSKIFFYIYFIIASLTNVSAEVRAIWALPWNLANRSAIDQLVQDAIENNQTEILAEVRYRADALYVPNRLSDKYYNPEPRSYILQENFDALDYLLSKAHAHNIKVQAWVTVFNATTTVQELINTNYIYRNYPHWITTDINGKPISPTTQMGYFIDPGIPEVQKYLTNIFLDIATGYPDLDGIHLDYIRYPARKYGYHPISIQRYKEISDSVNISWNEWRIRQVTYFVKNLRLALLEINPQLLLTAAVIANLEEAVIDYAQDWANWLNEGIIDRAYPMAYAKDNQIFTKVIDRIASDVHPAKVVVGLRAWQENGSNDYPVSKIIEKAKLCRQYGFGGLALFSYEGVRKSNMFPALYNELFYEPVQPELPEDWFITSLTLSQSSSIISLDTNKSLDDSLTINKPLSVSSDSLSQDSPKSPETFCDDIRYEDQMYYFKLFFHKQGKWHLIITDIHDIIVFKRFRSYQQGFQIDSWDGITDSGKTLSVGVYILTISDEFNKIVCRKRFIVE